MLMQSNKYLYGKYLLLSLFSLIYFQQVFVLNIQGGSLKLYEIAGVVIIFMYLLCTPYYLTTQLIFLFGFFIVSPVISDILFIIFADIDGYYKRFPDAVYRLRCNKIFALFYMLVLAVSEFCIAHQIIMSKFIYEKRDKIIKIFIITGTLIALYSLYQFIGMAILGLPDFIPSFMDARNKKVVKGWFRVLGFSDEPGSYVVIQSICVYYLLLYKRLFRKTLVVFLCILNFTVLLLTVSSAILITISGIIFYAYLSNNKRNKINTFLLFLLLIIIAVYFNFTMNGKIRYLFVEKLFEFFKGPTHTLSSSGTRAFTTRLGLKVFRENILFGCGFGCSNFFIYKYEFSAGIKTWGERLSAFTSPQNDHSKILAEQGLFGYCFFILFYLSTVALLYKYRKDQFIKVHFIITVSLFFFNFVIYPVTNLFLWLNIYLGLNYIHYNKQKHLKWN